LCDHAALYGITIGVENMVNMDFIFGKHAEEMLGMIESVDRDNLGMTFDVGHANTNRAVSSFLEKCPGTIVHVHLHDNKGRRDEHLPLGEGSVDWIDVTGKLAELDVRYVLESRTFEAGQQSIEFLRSL
jgi:sugar phosphate isomerase/epimerase